MATTIKRPNAWLQYYDPDTETTHRRYIWVMEISQPFQLAGDMHQAHAYQHFYTKSYAPGEMTIQGRVPTQEHYDRLSDFIRNWQLTVIKTGGASNLDPKINASPVSLMRLNIPYEGIAVDGLIKSFEAGQKRFNPAPPFTFPFEVIQDQHSKAIVSPSYAINNFFFHGAEILKGEVQTDPNPTTVDPITGNTDAQQASEDFHHRGEPPLRK